MRVLGVRVCDLCHTSIDMAGAILKAGVNLLEAGAIGSLRPKKKAAEFEPWDWFSNLVGDHHFAGNDGAGAVELAAIGKPAHEQQYGDKKDELAEVAQL